MIPKIIHYCWFGDKPKSKLALECIESWKKYCPDYELVEWNESNFDINSNQYIKEAYERKKWAFVTDYVRLYAMVEFGGIYMDTDVEVVGVLDDFLNHSAFSGFQFKNQIPTGIMACEKGFKLFDHLLSEYNVKTFINEDGTLNLTTNVDYITDYCLKNGLKLNNQYQVIDGFALYPTDWFCAKNLRTGKYEITENTRTIHHFSGSWLPLGKKVKKLVSEIFGHDFMVFCSKLKRFFFRRKS